MPVDCSRWQAALSERMDGERLAPRVTAALDQHLAGCATCRAFERGAFRVREQVRFGLAPAVPDLVEPIMSAVEREAVRGTATRTRLRVVRSPRELRPRRRLIATLAPAVAAMLVGAIAGSLLVGGPFKEPGGRASVAAATVTRGVASAASALSAYQASFQITEYHFATDVPVRELSMNVWFEAPERFRLDVADHTSYPSADFTPTDLSLVVNGSTWYSSGPAPCQFAQCPQKQTLITHRVPFSSTTSAPTDLVLPVTTLADANQLTVLGLGTVLGRDAVEVQLPFERATALFPFLDLGGSWRPFFPNDRVILWLDASNWFPLKWSVYPASGHERDQWALRFGLPQEPSKRAIFEVAAVSMDEHAPTPGTFKVPHVGSAIDAGATVVDLGDASKLTGFTPVTPSIVGGLDLYRVVLPPAQEQQTSDETLITYSKGLSWLKVGETRSWNQDAFFGPIGSHALQVSLPNGGVAYYEPATVDHGRRVSIHSPGTDLYVETNLSREELLGVAGSLPVRGIQIPEAWRVQTAPGGVTERVSLADAAGQLPFVLDQPTRLPAGYGFASAELVRLQDRLGVNVYFQQADADLGSGPIRLHAEVGQDLPPASSASQSAVEVRGTEGRWTPDRGQLEWVQDGVYYSLDASGLGLEDLLAVASSMEPFPSVDTGPSSAAGTAP
jgi:outer membrane lipoprotein-sorting protein